LNKIDENWDLFEHKTKIRTYLKKLDKNWDQKGILTFKIIMLTIGHTRYINTDYTFGNFNCNTNYVLLYTISKVI